ncbi:channel-forming protein ArfA/OmpATb [Mycobacterium asiaticum]|uniref:channel-forming protein ArfA/OmpATb n=1 Tax=Mycobacterium asiaticum TaxID=1790 RepID=UPI00264A1148|nr:OmpA family protein [Mycobacterium asiaticum]
MNAPPAPANDRQQTARTWLIAAAVIPFLIAIIGYGAYERPTGVNGPTGNLPTLASPTAGPSAAIRPLSLLSISRNGNSLTLIGDFPNEAAKATLMKSLRAMTTPGVVIVDQIRIDPLVRALDFAAAEPVFAAGAPIPDFTLRVEQDTVTLTGTAPSPDQKTAVEHAAASAWPDLAVNSKIATRAQITPGAPPSAAPGAASCNDLQAQINAMTGGPLAFGNDGVALTPQDKQILIKVADKLKACPNARVSINGYSDNSSSEAMNMPLTTQRATSVAEYLIANGVARDHVVAKGLGSANPIASNDTVEGRAKNRRVEIVVS